MAYKLAALLGVGSLFSSYQSSQAAKKQIRLQQAQYQRWKSLYGGIEENLSSYFGSLTPQHFAEQGINSFDKEYNQALTNIQQQFEQAGIDADSGLAQSINAQAELSAAETRANIRQQAEQQVIQSQASFLQMGQGQGLQASQGLANAYNQQAQNYGKASGSFLNAGLNAIGDYRYSQTLLALKGEDLNVSDNAETKEVN